MATSVSLTRPSRPAAPAEPAGAAGAAGTSAVAGAPARSWVRRVQLRVFLADAVAVYTAVFAAFLLRFGADDFALDAMDDGGLSHNYALISLALLVLWLGALRFAGTYQVDQMGCGSLEYARVARVSLAVFGGLAIVAYVARWQLARGFVALALPIGLLLLVLGRWLMRRSLVRERRAGLHRRRTLVVAGEHSAATLVDELRTTPEAGFDVVAVCAPGDLHTVTAHVAAGTIDVVVAAAGDRLAPRALQRLSWDLEDSGTALVLAPGALDVSHARLRTHPMPGMPLLAVDRPGYTAWQQRIKRVFDLVGSSFLVLLFALPLAATALAIRVTSPGPVIFRQTRIGEDGAPFTVLKFRSMRMDSDERAWDRARAAGEVPDGVGAFSKPAADPRVTPVGRFIRRYSIDELPQLFNVLAGQMSLVGPRPLLAGDHERYGRDRHRRLLVKPGITGLWQVSGRNHLSMEQSVRLDLYYVENWSLTEDLLILARTVRAVVARDGAY